MDFFGLTDDDYAEENTGWVWPCNLPVVSLFCEIGTQWRVSAAGPYGLDYNVLYHKMDRMGLTPEKYSEMEGDIRILETAALDQMRKDQD